MSNFDDSFCGDRSVKRDSERYRRDRLNESIVALSRLLPSFDESKIYSKMEVINQSRRYICELVEQNRRLLSAENGKENVQNGRIVYLTERVRYLLNRNHQLSAMLREAKIRIPSHEDMVRIAKSKRLLAKKMKSEAAAAAAAAATTAAAATRTSQSESTTNEPGASGSSGGGGGGSGANESNAPSTPEIATTATSTSNSNDTNAALAVAVTVAVAATNSSSAKSKKSTNDKDSSASDKSTNSSESKKKPKTQEQQVSEKRNVPADGAATPAAAVTGSVQPPAAIIVVKKVPAKTSRKSSSTNEIAAIKKIDPRLKILLPPSTTPKVPIPKLGSEKPVRIAPHKMPMSDVTGVGRPAGSSTMTVRGTKKVRRRIDGMSRGGGGSSSVGSSSSSGRGGNGGSNSDSGISRDSNREKTISKASLSKKLKTIQQKIVSDRTFEDEITSKESDLQKIKQRLQHNQKLLKDHYSKSKTSESVNKSPGKKQSGHKNYTIDSLCSAQNQSWDGGAATAATATGTVSVAKTTTTISTSTTSNAGNVDGVAVGATATAGPTSAINNPNMNSYQRSSVITQQMTSSNNYELPNDLLQTLSGGTSSSDSLGHHAMTSTNVTNESSSSSLSPTANFLSHFPLVSSGGGNGNGNISHPPIVNHSNNGMMLPAITTTATTSITFGHDIWSTAATAAAAAATSTVAASTATTNVPNNDHLIGHNRSALDNSFCSLADQLNSGDKFYMDLARNSTDFRNMQSLATTEKKLPKDNFLEHFIDREFPQFNEFGLSMTGANGSGSGSNANTSTSTKSTTQNFFPFAQPHHNQPLPHHQQQQQHPSPPKQAKVTNSKPVNWMTTPPHSKNTSSLSSSSSSSTLNPFATFSNSSTQNVTANATAASAPPTTSTSRLNNNNMTGNGGSGSSAITNNSLDFLFQPFGCTGNNSSSSRPSLSLPASNSHSVLKDLVAETSYMETGPLAAAAPSSTTQLIEWSSSSHKYHQHHYQNHASATANQSTSSASATNVAAAASSSSLLLPNDSLQASLDLGLMPQLPSLSSHQTNATSATTNNNTFNNFSVSHLMDNNNMQLGLSSYQPQPQQQQQQRHHQLSHHHHQQQQQPQQQQQLQHQQPSSHLSSKQTTFFNPVNSNNSNSGHKSSSSSSSSNRKNWIDLNFQPHKSFQYSAESLISSHPTASNSSTTPMLASNDLWTPATVSSTSSYQNPKVTANHPHHPHHPTSYNSNNGFAPLMFQAPASATTATATASSVSTNNDYHDLHLPTNVFDFESCATASVPSVHHSMIAP